MNNKIDIEVKKMIVCPECLGKKKIRVGSNEEPDIIECPTCHGLGKIEGEDG